MNMRKITLASIILLALAFTISVIGAAQENKTSNATELVDDIESYEGSIGPGSALYGLKIAFDNIDETFTFNKSEKIGKQVAHAKERLSEAKAELKKKNNKAAEKALEEYRVKIEEAEGSVSGAATKDKGLLNAQKMIEKHQYVLERLLEENSNNTGLARAYNNSLELEKEFEAKTKIKLERRLTKEGRRVLEEVEANDEEEQVTKIEAKVFSNGSHIEVELKFMTNNTENFTIADEIVDKLKLSTENINALLKIEEENDNDESKLVEKLEAGAEVKENISKVKFEYKFPLNKTDEPGIAAGIHEKLSKLTPAMVLDVLEMKVKEEKKEIKETEEKDKKEENHQEKREEKHKEERKDKINDRKED